MVLDKYRCIFVHVPKCAGESIEIALSGAPYNIDEYEGHPEKHWGVREIRSAYPEQFARYFSFAVIRNPWERVVSWVSYRDKRRRRTAGSPQSRLAMDLQDQKFLKYMAAHSLVNMLVLDGRIAVNRVIRMENLQEGFADVCKTLGVDHAMLPHANRTHHVSYVDIYDAATRQQVADLFAEDIRFFGYTFGDQ